jgi:Tfp pilus assembly protein PilZ
MTLRYALNDDQIGQFVRKTNAILDRTGKSLAFDDVMTALQLIHDGKFVRAEKVIGDDLLVVDYAETLEQMIAAGRYDWVNSDITATRFPIVGSGVKKFEFKLDHPNRNISSKDEVRRVLKIDTAKPWMPAKIEHQLSFGKQFPEEQRKYPIVALGSVVKLSGHRRVPGLWGNDAGRGLDLFWWEGDWRGRCRFLLVREVSEA